MRTHNFLAALATLTVVHSIVAAFVGTVMSGVPITQWGGWGIVIMFCTALYAAFWIIAGCHMFFLLEEAQSLVQKVRVPILLYLKGEAKELQDAFREETEALVAARSLEDPDEASSQRARMASDEVRWLKAAYWRRWATANAAGVGCPDTIDGMASWQEGATAGKPDKQEQLA